MRSPGVCLLLLAVLVPGLAQGRPEGPGASTPAARRDVRLIDWARSHDYHLTRAPGSDLLQLTNAAGARLVFAVNSQRAGLNGVEVFLSFPVALRGGEAWISDLDTRTTLQPILFPARDRRAVPVVHVCLDAGHGGRDPGNEAGREKEKEFTLSLTHEVRRILVEAGLKVTLTRQHDVFVPLSERPEIARKRFADLFVSLHFNAAIANKEEIQGVETYCLTPAGARSTYARNDPSDPVACPGNRFDARNVLLAYQIQKAMAKGLPAVDRGVKRARFAVLRTAEMPAVLVEAGFMSHPSESRKILDADYRKQLARTIARGILAYRDLVNP